jgi:hypothetical protein
MCRNDSIQELQKAKQSTGNILKTAIHGKGSMTCKYHDKCDRYSIDSYTCNEDCCVNCFTFKAFAAVEELNDRTQR